MMIFVTGNKNKAVEAQSILGKKIDFQLIDLPEIQALNVEEVVKAKAESAYALLKRAVLIEDSGLVVLAWKGLPGACTKWFMKSVRSIGITRMLANQDRSALAVAVYDYYDGKNHFVFNGVVTGKIAAEPIGDSGFGWDDIFIPEGSEKTFAQMSQDEKNKISMRRIALEKLKKFLVNT